MCKRCYVLSLAAIMGFLILFFCFAIVSLSESHVIFRHQILAGNFALGRRLSGSNGVNWADALPSACEFPSQDYCGGIGSPDVGIMFSRKVSHKSFVVDLCCQFL